MQTMSHDYSRLYHRGLRGWERRDRGKRLRQAAKYLLATAALIGVYCVMEWLT